MCTDQQTKLGNSRRPASRCHLTNHFSPSNGYKLASRWVDTTPPMRERRISPQRSRSSMKRFALSLLASATLLALSDPSFAFTYEYIDRYPEPITTHNAWQPVEVNEERPLQFEGDYVIGYHGKDPDSDSSSSSSDVAVNVNIQTGRRDLNEMTITGRTLRIIERPTPALSNESLSNRAIKFYESTQRESDRGSRMSRLPLPHHPPYGSVVGGYQQLRPS